MNSKLTLTLNPVTPVLPVAPWLGGKRNLAKRICALIDTIPCSTYAEPFVGMGGIFLRRTSRPRAEVINDYGRDVANLFRILQRHYVAFLDVLRFQLTTRAEFYRLVEGCSLEAARDLMDSTHGRHFADEVANQLARRLTLDTAIRAAIDVFQGWRIDRRITRQYSIPAGLPYLTGWAHHFEILGEAG